jgi:hypothetical protein
VGEGPNSQVTRVQTGSIQSVDERVDEAGAVILTQRGVPTQPKFRAPRGGWSGESGFLVSELRLPSSSWPPCVTTINRVAHHVRIAKTQGGYFFSPGYLPLLKSRTFSAKEGSGEVETQSSLLR